MSTLRQIGAAKELLAGNKRLSDGDAVVMTDIWPEYVKCPGEPKCPGGGTITVQPIGSSPECSLSEGFFAHLGPY